MLSALRGRSERMVEWIYRKHRENGTHLTVLGAQGILWVSRSKGKIIKTKTTSQWFEGKKRGLKWELKGSNSDKRSWWMCFIKNIEIGHH